MNELDQLYQQVILDHSRERHGEGLVDDAQASSHQVNPTCGDDVELNVRIQDGRLVAWAGTGTAAPSPRPPCP